MYTYKKLLLAGALGVLASSGAWADSATSSHNVTLDVPEVYIIDMHDPVAPPADPTTCSLTHNGEAGTNFSSKTITGYTYDITSNTDGTKTRKLQAKLSAAITVSATLSVNVTAPTANGTSAGSITLTITDQDVVTSIGNTAETAIPVSYICALSGTTVPNYGFEAMTVDFTLLDDA